MTTIDMPTQHAHDGSLTAAGVVTEQHSTAETAVNENEVLWADPRELIIGDNVRTDRSLDRGFVADIRDRGVRQVIPVRRDEVGRLVVRTGQKRVLAAIKAGLDRVRVLVEAEALTEERERTIDRILDQLGENEHRSGIGAADEARATQQLLGLGLSAGQIARRRHIGTKRVRTAVAVARSQVAMDAVADGRLDLAQAAVVAKFADDDVAVSALSAAARQRPEQFDHLAQQLRDAREEARLRAELTAALTAQGARVIDRPDTLFGGPVRRLSELRATPEAEPGAALTAEEHAGCPGHAAFLDDRGSWRPAGERVVPVWVCTDFPAHGHAERYPASGAAATGRVAGPMTEAQKAERREVIANNKAWDSATTVRRAWLARFLARKTVPADAARWIAQTLARGCHDLRRAMESGHPVAAELLGLPRPDQGPARYTTPALAAATAQAGPARAATLTVAMLLGALEAGTSRHTWRCPTADQVGYFRQLQRWNYPLSDVELLVLTPTGPDEPTPATPQTDADGTASDAVSDGVVVAFPGQTKVDEVEPDGAGRTPDVTV